MKYVLRTLVALVGVVGVVATVGWLLPVAHVASRTATIAAPPEMVFDLVRDVVHHPRWRSDVTAVDLLDSTDGRLRFREHAGGETMTLEIVEAVRPRRLVTRIAEPNLPFGGTWTFEIEPDPAGTRMTITERGEVYSPIFRFVGRFVIGHHRTLDRYLGDLASHMRKVTPAGAR